MDARQALQSNYIKSADLQGRTVRVTISGVQMETVGQGKQAEEKLVLYFTGGKKGMVLNVTNINVLGEIANSFETNDWIGWRVTLCVRKVDFEGRRVDGLRIDDTPGTFAPPAAQYNQPNVAPTQPAFIGGGVMPQATTNPSRGFDPSQAFAPRPAAPAEPSDWSNYGSGPQQAPHQTPALTDDDIPF